MFTRHTVFPSGAARRKFFADHRPKRFIGQGPQLLFEAMAYAGPHHGAMGRSAVVRHDNSPEIDGSKRVSSMLNLVCLAAEMMFEGYQFGTLAAFLQHRLWLQSALQAEKSRAKDVKTHS
jgi:hypothetical protein